MPAPGSPGMMLLAPVIVIRSHFVGPGRTRSCCVPLFGAVAVVAWPAAVLTLSWLAIARMKLSSSSCTPMWPGRFTGALKLIWIHWPTGVMGLPSAQAVSLSPSNAFTGSYCGS